MSPDKKILVTGASGFLGWNICRIAAEHNQVAGIFNRHPFAIDGIEGKQCDLTNYRELKKMMDRLKPDAVIHAAAAANLNYCQEHPSETRQINVIASESIAGLCNDAGIACIFISTDQVFDGSKAPYAEEDMPCPINIYGEQKLEAEQIMHARHDRLVICRMPLMYGDAPPAAQSFIQPLIRDLQEGRMPALFVDEFRTPVGGNSAAQGILRMLDREPVVIHLGGREKLSRYDLGVRLARILGKPDAQIRAVYRKDITMPAPRPCDLSFDSSRAFALGFSPASFEREAAALECMDG